MAPKTLLTRKRGFDPEGEGYDYETAERYGIKRDETGHYPSRVELSEDDAAELPRGAGLILKGRKHPTYHKTEKGEAEAGYRIERATKGRYRGRYISVPAED